ncbi:AraC family transcriptional regulator [Shimia biformata]|uniref:AraC family transcriptional regulator n=1 Tax=Shimia biformata TaxID=1294299 RepID=UPI00194E2DFE|nr:AraC family transcriptional regulator [Shimia biformata]
MFRSTTVAPASERFDFFCDAICSTFVGIQPERLSNRVFNADFTSYEIDGCHLVTIRAPGHRASRDTRHLRHMPDDSLFLNFQPGQPYRYRANDEDTVVPPAAVRLIDNARPFSLDFLPGSNLNLFSLRLPRNLLGGRNTPATIAQINNHLGQAPVGRLVAAQYQLAALAVRSGDANVVKAMGRALINLVSCLAENVAPEVPQSDVALMKIWAEARLSDPDLNVTSIAKQFGVSVRTVQARFREDGSGVSEWVRQTRLEAAMTALRDPGQKTKPASTIAVQAGFRSIEHFNRAFRAQFGVTPVQARRLAQS